MVNSLHWSACLFIAFNWLVLYVIGTPPHINTQTHTNDIPYMYHKAGSFRGLNVLWFSKNSVGLNFHGIPTLII